MDLGLAGKIALVTGGTRGIGLAIARALAAEGARIAVAARTATDVEKVAEELRGHGVAADLTTEAGCSIALEETRRALGPVSVLVNNLGLRASRGGETAPATALADLPTDHSYLDIPAFLRRQAD